MMRLACLLALLSLIPLVLFIVDLSGATATIFSFVGMPCLGLALLSYFIVRWRAGAFHSDHSVKA